MFFPTQPWSVNYFDAVGGGPTHLAITPSQFLATPGAETGTRRTFTSMNFELFYSSNLDAIPVRGHPGVFNRPGLSAAPAIAKVAGVPTGQTIEFTADVVGDPTVGIQQVWVTYTVLGAANPTWTSVDLVQATGPYSLSNPSSRWRGTLTLPSGQSTSNVRFIVQAVNGVGLTTLSTNLGAYYTPAPDEVPNNDPKDPTQVTLLSPPGGGDYREQVTVRARLTRNGTALANQTLSFGIGSGRRLATTNASGEAQTVMTLLHTPGAYDLVASFQETDTLLGLVRSARVRDRQARYGAGAHRHQPERRHRRPDDLCCDASRHVPRTAAAGVPDGSVRRDRPWRNVCDSLDHRFSGPRTAAQRPPASGLVHGRCPFRPHGRRQWPVGCDG